MKTFVIGDIHGAYKALQQCLERSNFNYQEDRLISLGDVCDGWPQVNLCIDELLKINHLDYILGNHDIWSLEWMQSGLKEDIWLMQGGLNTMGSYVDQSVPKEHVEFLRKSKLWIEFENKLFVHAGYDPQKTMSEQDPNTLVWDRTLFHEAIGKEGQHDNFKYEPYDEIFVGHTPTINFGIFEPLKFCNLWAIDTGAGWNGKLTIMDVHTKKFWQSDQVPILYPGIRGRR